MPRPSPLPSNQKGKVQHSRYESRLAGVAELFAAFAVSCLGPCKGGNMSSTRNPGRVAGFLYLLLVVFAPFRLIYIPSTLIVPGNATATANNIAAHALLFRLGIVA